MSIINHLLIKPTTDKTKVLYDNHKHYNPGDSGLDLYIPNDVDVYLGETKFIDLEIQCEMMSHEICSFSHKIGGSGPVNTSYYLYPRSSISKTPLILANQVGIIDAGYRGNIIAAVRYVPNINDIFDVFNNRNELINCPEPNSIFIENLPKYTIKAGTRLFQICSNNLSPFGFKIVDKLSDTKRGTDGFGSTGK